DERVAAGFVEYYWIGDRSPGPDRKGERETDARQWIRFNFEQIGPADATPTAIATLAAVALGVWKPNGDLLAQLKVYADAVAGGCRAGPSCARKHRGWACRRASRIFPPSSIGRRAAPIWLRSSVSSRGRSSASRSTDGRCRCRA